MNRQQRRADERAGDTHTELAELLAELLRGTAKRQVAEAIVRYGGMLEIVESGVAGYVAGRTMIDLGRPGSWTPATVRRTHAYLAKGLADLELLREAIDAGVAVLDNEPIDEVETLRERLAATRSAFDSLPPAGPVH